MRHRLVSLFAILTAWLAASSTGRTQANLPIYTDNLVNGFQNWSWAAVNFSATDFVQAGSYSISISNNTNYQALYLEHPNFNTSPYASLGFWINGGSAGGQNLSVHGITNGSSAGSYDIGPLAAGTWQQFAIPLSSLGIAGVTNCSGIWIQGNSRSAQPVFYVDDIQLIAAPAPVPVHLTVDANQPIRSADARWFGLNTAVWDSNFDTASTSNALKELGTYLLRFPGGSLSDEYHWATDTSLTNTRRWATAFNNFMHIATNLDGQAIITVNYGTGTSNEAAAWVKSANLTNHCGFKYWEIGNECYGTWETDSNTRPHDPYTYAVRAAGYIQLMKAADPTIKIGVVAEPGEDDGANGYTDHPATNALTGQVHYGWTPVILSTLRNLGVTPDFLIDHRYPEYTAAGSVNSGDSDPLLLQSTSWAGDAADLRAQINGYFGAGGSNIELCVTENNSDSGAQGRQSTSIVNALYLADSLGQLMQTEFNSFIWWDLRNGADTNGDFDPTLYGWRTNGDLGVILGANTRYPTFYACKLMRDFVPSGDTVLNATSDYLLLSVYGTRHPDGSLGLLVINKDLTTAINAQIHLANFAPASTATVRSYGIAQDEATRTNGPAAAQDIYTNTAGVGATFTNSFPPGSLTLFTFAPTPAQLAASRPQPSQFVLQLRGQPGTPYVIQSSSDLFAWTPVATNTLNGNTLSLTNTLWPNVTRQFWRAVWLP